ncbi:MAG: transporter ATP-binding protein [Enterovirga sp.]|jgi:branched-chain amino acid transport system ATP-binding protein|nr:transporter ATP-binding protein [Enterovirga sp.]
MSAPILAVQDLCLRFGGLIATNNVSFSVKPDELHAIIGPNGAGKSTLIAQLAGDRLPDSGQILLGGADVTGLPSHARAQRGLGRSFQITSVFSEFTTLANVALAVQAGAGSSFRFWKRAAREHALVEPARAILDRVGLSHRADVPAGALAHGEKRALELGIALARRPRLLLLDEPMAGMGPEEAARMVELLAALKGSLAMVLVEHDMDAVFRLADRISVLVYGRLIATGSPEETRSNPEVRQAYLGEDE